jgi:hypothetical protein
VALSDEAREALLEQIKTQAARTSSPTGLRNLAEAYVWVIAPSNSHGGREATEAKYLYPSPSWPRLGGSDSGWGIRAPWRGSRAAGVRMVNRWARCTDQARWLRKCDDTR